MFAGAAMASHVIWAIGAQAPSFEPTSLRRPGIAGGAQGPTRAPLTDIGDFVSGLLGIPGSPEVGLVLGQVAKYERCLGSVMGSFSR